MERCTGGEAWKGGVDIPDNHTENACVCTQVVAWPEGGWVQAVDETKLVK